MKRYHGDFMLRRFTGYVGGSDEWHMACPEFVTDYMRAASTTKPYGRYTGAEYVFSSRSVPR